LAGQPAVEKSVATVLSELFKARLTAFVLLTTAVGYYLGSRGPLQWSGLLHTLTGTGMLAAGAAALNQFLEREHDARMKRTEDRPLPAGRLRPQTVLLLGGALTVAGMIYLAALVNLLTSVLGILTLVCYVFVYTPLKRVTTLNTLVGAIPGALPPLMGWTGATNQVTAGGWALFAILFFWQLPHFYAIAWLYRDDYAKAGYAMLPVVDATGERTGRQAVSHTLGLLTMSLFPVVFGLAGVVYGAGALVLGAGFLVLAIRFSRRMTAPRARALFFASIIYLPLLLALLVFDKVKG
jgi:protoheme IX farnesyltransferase